MGTVGSAGSTRPTASFLVGVGFSAAITIALQILLTRFFSAAVFYHFTFLAVSLAFLGTGAGALLVSVRPQWFAEVPVTRLLTRWTAALGVALALLPLVLLRLDYTYVDFSLRFGLTLAVACVVSALPSFLAGVVITLALRAFPDALDRVYSADLFAAGGAAASTVPFMWLAPAPTLLAGLGLLAALATLAFAEPPRAARARAIAVAVASLCAMALTTTPGFKLSPPFAIVRGAHEFADRWTPLSRVMAFWKPGQPFAQVFYDKVFAPVFPYRRGDPPLDWRDLHLGPQSIGYALTGPGHALVIGGGGGRDILNALSSGQQVDVIEINDGIRRVVDSDMASVSGSPYSLPAVQVTVGDGRSVLAARDRRYSQVHLSFTDTLSVNSASAFALVENNLYTLEAVDAYLDHLAPGGVLSVSRLLRLVGDEALRATVLVLEALRQRGIEHPEQHVVVLKGQDVLAAPYGTILAKLEPFSDDEMATIRRLAAERSEGILFAPGGPYREQWADLAAAASPSEFCERYPMDVCPPSDDQPFFFNMTRLRNLNASGKEYIYPVDPMLILFLTFGILVALGVLCYLVPLAFVDRTARPPAGALTYFVAIGVGFVVLELVTVQRFVLFLGFPTYALSVVLLALLVSTGVGSRLAGRPSDPRRVLLVALGVGCALMSVAAFALQPLLRAIIALPFPWRVATAIALITPFGVCMGTAMPIGLRRIEGLYPGALPFAWGINGIASVVASVLAIAVAILLGFTIATLVAAACYGIALAHAALGPWPHADAASETAGAASRLAVGSG